jgi:hypothetical protein
MYIQQKLIIFWDETAISLVDELGKNENLPLDSQSLTSYHRVEFQRRGEGPQRSFHASRSGTGFEPGGRGGASLRFIALRIRICVGLGLDSTNEKDGVSVELRDPAKPDEILRASCP